MIRFLMSVSDFFKFPKLPIFLSDFTYSEKPNFLVFFIFPSGPSASFAYCQLTSVDSCNWCLPLVSTRSSVFPRSATAAAAATAAASAAAAASAVLPPLPPLPPPCCLRRRRRCFRCLRRRCFRRRCFRRRRCLRRATSSDAAVAAAASAAAAASSVLPLPTPTPPPLLAAAAAASAVLPLSTPPKIEVSLIFNF